MNENEQKRLLLIKYCNKYLSQSNILMKPFIRKCLDKLERKKTIKTRDIYKLSHLLSHNMSMTREQVHKYFKPLTIKSVKPDTSIDLTQFFT